ncbi:MAG TPA: DUF2007 domain-containing protein [Crenotrichaceae bacterium]|nr:DUF2007 domain-containing protein [Crenotrichaceae bacterium]
MQQIYEADTIVDASIVKGLLEQVGIQVYFSGYYLQGGIGELPASGMTSLWVDDKQVAFARQAIAEYLVQRET